MRPYSRRAEPTIRRMLKHWPTLMGTRQRVLDHLLFSFGTGREWVDGCLADTTGGDSPHGRIIQKRRDDAHIARIDARLGRHPGTKLIQEALDDSEPKWLERARQVHWNIPCDYSPIVNVPDDVTPDWLAVCIEACEGFLHCSVEDTCYPDHPVLLAKARKQVQTILEKLRWKKL